jgi:predicted RNase H-like HicB family nuclease
MKPLTYKGYAAHVEFDAEDRLFFGRVAGIRDIISFHGESVDELVKAFEDAVDDYLETSEKIGRAPQNPTPVSSCCACRRKSTRMPPRWPRRTARVSMPGLPRCWRGQNKRGFYLHPLRDKFAIMVSATGSKPMAWLDRPSHRRRIRSRA